VFPWALLYLAAPLVARGHQVHIVDEPAEPDALKRLEHLLRTLKPVAVGITSMTGEQIRFGLRCAELVRKHSSAAIVWGGIHPSLLPEQTTAHPLVDYSVAGEGENAFTELVDRLANGATAVGIPGVYRKTAAGVCGMRQDKFLSMAELPPLPFDLIQPEPYVSSRRDLDAKRYFEVCTSRGCPHRCAFCYIESVHGRKWRAMEADASFDRIKDTVARFDLDCVLFREDNFFVDRSRVEHIARRFVEELPGVKWAASCRINYVANYTDEFVDLLDRSGCALLTFGVESGSDRVLKLIQKDITRALVLKVVEKLARTRICGTYHFMGGFPTETAQEFLETCRLMDDIGRIDARSVIREMSIFAPYPGISLIPLCVEHGYHEPQSLDEWVKMDWSNPERPWLNERQSRLISDAQFLIARLDHPNAIFRAFARLRWRQMLASDSGIRLIERPAFEAVRNQLRKK
jgi:radical SAM superfamily enzyme YgiQ (UPF0313 family)